MIYHLVIIGFIQATRKPQALVSFFIAGNMLLLLLDYQALIGSSLLL